MKYTYILIAAIVSLVFVLSPSNAAEIKAVKSHPMGCEYILSGIIINGDAEAIEEVLKSNWTLGATGREWKICLSSPGGSFVEGVKIAHIFATYTIGTVVAQNDRCESACAIAFLGGSYSVHYESGREVSRTIHPTAKLGFHVPELLVDDSAQYTNEEVNKAYEIALNAVVELSEMRTKGYDITESLFKIILTTPYKSMHYVDTVGRALRYKIDVSDIKYISPYAVQGTASYICSNAILKNDPNIAEVETQEVGNNNFKMIGDKIRSNMGYYAEGFADCQISINTDSNSFTVSFLYGGNSEEFNITHLSALASFPSHKRLSSAFSEQSLSGTEFQTKANKSIKTNPKTCFLNSWLSRVINVKNFTNLRESAGLNGQVIAEVPLGAKVSIVNPGGFLFYERCRAACNGSDQNAIEQCIKNNDIWIEVEYNGRNGFLSRQFLE